MGRSISLFYSDYRIIMRKEFSFTGINCTIADIYYNPDPWLPGMAGLSSLVDFDYVRED